VRNDLVIGPNDYICHITSILHQYKERLHASDQDEETLPLEHI
jgi:hypothetical protein